MKARLPGRPMQDHPEPVEHVGYLTSVSTTDGGGRELYLHTEGRSLRVLFGPDDHNRAPQEGHGSDLPLGPKHRVRITGSVAGQSELPVLWATSAELLGRGRC